MKSFLSLVACLILISCQPSQKKSVDQMSDEELNAYASELAHRFIIADTHVDLPYRLIEEEVEFTDANLQGIIATTEGDFDFDRAKKGGLDAPFMSIYIPSSYQNEPGMGKSLADSLIQMVNWIANGLPEKFGVATSPADVQKLFREGKIALPMGMENGAPIGNDLANVKYFYDKGIRYVTLTHGKDNQICDSSYDTTRTWNGLSPFGRDVVAEMNRVGIMVDISHVSDSTFYQVMEITKAPAIASHSSCRAFTPGFERNMSDDMIQKLALNGGVIQINFGSSFLDSAVVKYNRANQVALRTQLEEKGLKESDEAAKAVIDAYFAANPKRYADVKTVADHIDHVVKLAGIDHVGIGSDYDGVGDSLPTGLKDVSQFPNLIAELLRRGYSEEDIEKICSGNTFRIWNQVAEVASRLQAGS
ncbi:MAG: dipeptidase [Cyclobacteriaceae bacterium]